MRISEILCELRFSFGCISTNRATMVNLKSTPKRKKGQIKKQAILHNKKGSLKDEVAKMDCRKFHSLRVSRSDIRNPCTRQSL
jgi:hypothetical protein